MCDSLQRLNDRRRILSILAGEWPLDDEPEPVDEPIRCPNCGAVDVDCVCEWGGVTPPAH